MFFHNEDKGENKGEGEGEGEEYVNMWDYICTDLVHSYPLQTVLIASIYR